MSFVRHYLHQPSLQAQSLDTSCRHYHQKGRKWKENGVTGQVNLKSNQAKLHEVSRPGNNLWLKALLPAIQLPRPWSTFPLLWRVAYICNSVVLSACFLLVGLLESNSLLSFQHLSILFSPSWQCFCWYNILKTLVGLLCMPQGFTPLYQRFSIGLPWKSHLYFCFLLRWLRRSVNYIRYLQKHSV